MPIESKKVKTLYDALVSDGADVGTEDEFNNWFFAKGKQGYKNRKTVFDAFKADGADVGETYEEFSELLGLHAVKPTAAPAQQSNYQQTLNDAAGTLAENQRTLNRIGNREQRMGLDTGKPVQIGGDAYRLGQNRKVTKGQQRYNTQTGQMEDTYVTESGNEYENRELANLEQNAVDQAERQARYMQTLPGQLEDAYAERDRINEELAKHKGEWVDADGRVHYDNRADDEAVAALEAAYRQNQERITALEAERDDDGGTQFWRGFIDAAMNPSVQTFGISDFNTAISLMRVKQKVDAAQEAGQQPQLSPEEQQLLESTFLNNSAQQQFGDNRGFMYRAGGISMQALPFVAEFMLTGGMAALSEAGAKYGTMAAEKMALQGLSKTLVKNLGIVAGDVAAGFAMANTTGIFRTAGDVMERNIGDVTINPEGQYDFGHYEDGKFVRGGKSLGRSIYEAEVANMLEYYTEKLGMHLHIGNWLAKGAEKMGLSKLSKAITYLSNSAILESGGIQDYPSEVVEEQANLLLNALLVGDNNFSIDPDSKDFDRSVFNPKTQADIWGGMLFSIGLMQSPRLAYTGKSAIGYYFAKQTVDVADANAGVVFGDENWQQFKEQIDGTNNEQVADLVQNIVEGDMNSTQKAAALNYVGDLLKMRGYNMGLMADTKDVDASMSEEAITSNIINQSYTEGYNAPDADTKKTYADEAQAAEQNLSQYGEYFAQRVKSGLSNQVESLRNLLFARAADGEVFSDEKIAAAADFYQKWNRAQGMMTAASDQIDLAVERENAAVRLHTHQETGNVYVASYGGEPCYIIGGTVAFNLDGEPIADGTGGAVVVIDAAGNTSVKPANEVLIHDWHNAEELMQQNETALRQQLEQQVDDDITYGVPAQEVFQQEDTIALNDGQGGVVEGVIGMLPNAVDGVYVIYTNDGQALQMTDDELQRRIVVHNGVEVKAAPVEQNGGQIAQEGAPIAQNPTQNAQGAQAAGEAGSVQTGGNEPAASAISKIPVRMGDDGKPVTNRKGKPVLDWHKASVEDAAAALVETTGGDMLMARDTASDLARQAESALEKIRKQKPKGEDPIEMAESRVAIRRQEQEQQAIIKQWKDVNHLIQQQMQQAQQKAIAEREAAKSEEQRQREAEEAKAIKERQDAEQAERRRKQIEEEVAQWNKPYAPLTKAKREMAGDADALEILNNVEPRSLEEWVSSLIRPQSMMWEDETDEASGRTIIGLQSELGLQKKDVERIGGLVATRKKGGKPFGQVVHDIWEDLPDGMKNMYDDQDVRNTLIGLFNEGNTMRMRHLTEEHRIEEARAMMQENERRDAEAELEAWAEAYHLTPEERETFEDYMQQAPTAIEQEIINNILADESYRRSRELDQQPVSGTNVPGATESQEEVRQASQAVSTGDNEEAATQGRQTATGEQTSVADNVPGRTQSLEREYIKEMLHQIGEDVSVANAMSDYEVEQLNAMLEDWDAHNDDYGMVIEQQKDALKSKDKKVRDAAQKKIDEAQAVANQAFEPVAMYIEELKAKYANVEEEGVIPRPKIDNPRFKAIRQNLVDALSLFLDTNTNATDVWAAAKAIRDYVDEGLDIDLDTNDDENLADWAFDYDGNDPEKLADQYIGRVYFDRYLDDDEDQEYIRSGILASMRNDNKFINGFEANENGVCINPHTIGEHKEKNNINVGFTIETAETDKGWVGGISCGHSTGGWGNPVCAGINERYFETEKECQAYWAQQIIDYFAHDGKKDSKVKKYIPSLQNIVNKGKKAKKPEITNDVNKTPSDAEKDVTLQQAISEVGNEIDARPVKAISSEADLQEYVNAGVAQNILNPIREDLNDPSVMGRYESDLMGIILLFAEKIKAAGLTKEQIKGICYHENVHSLADRGFTPADFEEAATLIDRVQPDLVKWAREKGAEDNLSDEAVNEEIVSYFVQFVDDKIAFLKGELDFGDKDLNRKMDKVAALLTNNKYGTGQKNEEVPPSTPGGVRESVSVDEAAKEVSEQESERGTVDQQPIGKTSSPEEIAQEEARVDANPTEAQKEAGNYLKGHINVDGYDITIENPKGSIRRGTDADGREWQQEMHNTYGYIKGTEGVDGDHIDVFLSDNPASGKVWVIDQVNPKTGEFDEHKVMYGFVDAMQATQAYLSNYEDGWKGLGSISGISREEFKKWVESSHRKTKPFRDYALAKSAEAKEKKEKKTAQPKEHKRIVSDDQMEELRKKLLEKFNNANAGIDVERMLLGAMYAVGKIERGVTKFADYAAQMVDEIGDAIRPYLKAFYEAVRNMPEAAEYRDLMDTPEYVAAFDEYNFDKAVKTPNAITKAKQVVKKTKAKQQVKKIEKEVNQKLQQGDLFAGMFDETPAETGKKPVESGNKPAETGKPKQPVLRKAVPEDFDNDNPVVYYQGRPWSIIALTRKGEQVSATQFSKPTIESVVLTNGKSVPFSELMVEDKNAGKPQRKTAWWQDPNRPANLDPSDYKTYTTDEAKTYFASFVGPNNEKGKPFPDFTKWAHPNLAYITAAAWDGAIIPKEELMQIPEIAEAEENINNVESKGSLTISEDEMRQHAQHLLDAEHGSQVYKDGKKVKKDFSGPVKQEHTALIIIGKPAGGKSSVFAEQLSHDFGARIIDSDTVKPWLEGFDGGNGAGYVHDASAKVADMALDMAVEAGDNIIIPRIGGESVVKKLAVPRLIEKGYTVQLYFNDVLESTSIMRAASRFAEEGRYLSLVYLTRINDKDYKTFCNFAEKKIGDFYDERDNAERPSESPVLDMVLLGGERSKQGGNTSSGERTSQSVSPVVHDSGSLGGLRGTGKEVAEGERIFSYAEWKSNDVAFGEKPKEIWNSESGTPLSDVIKKQNNENQRTLSAKSSPVSEGTGQASGTADRAGEGRGTEPNRVERPGSASTVTTPAPAKPKQELHKNKRNNQGERGKDYAPTSVKARFNANVEAIKMMHALMDDGIEAPTKDQMEVLRQYSGWGGMGTYFNDESTAENKILRDLLDDEEYNDAVMSINSAYYTPATVIDTLWDIAKAMGFKGGNVLEGSAGIGNIIGQMPRDISRRSDIEAVEIDAISGNILKLLYPDAKVHIQGFQDTVIRNGSVDLAVTNVPFVTGLHVFDKVDKDLSRKFTNIHDFCIAKNIRKLREGGIGLFITSSGTLDKSTKLREWITDEGQADVVGAFRLNNETFGGTSVTSDIIVVRKRVNGQRSSSAIDVSKATPLRIGNYEDKYRNEHQVSMVVNDYFKEHPEMMAGEMFFGYEKGDTFRPGSYGLYPVDGKSQEKMMADFVKSMEKTAETVAAPVEKAVAVPNQLTAVKEGRMLVDDNGRLCISRYGEAVPLGVNDNKVKGQTKQQCFKDYQSVQAAVDEVLQQQLNDPDDAALQPKLDALNKAYDQFVKRYGIPYKNTAISFLRNDIDFPSFMALANYSETKDMKGKVTVTSKKSPLFSRRVLGFKTEPKPQTVKDAVIASIFRTNGIDLEWIAAKLSEVAAPPNGDHWTADDVRKGVLVSRLGFENPSTGQLEVRHQYLSGNVREKLAIAESYNTDGRYNANVEELRKVVPVDIPAHLIDFSLGSSWIPNELYIDFIKESLGLDNVTLNHLQGRWSMVVNEWTAKRSESNKAKGVYSEKFHTHILGSDLLLSALNNRPYKVARQETEGYGSNKTTHTVVDQEATSACNVRIDEIKDEFKQYIRKRVQDDTELARRIEKIYNDKFNALVPMRVDDEMLPEKFDGANTIISLYDHQKRGVMRGVTSPTMLAHEVGTGKSFTLITTAMEMRRLGTAKKPMIVVQNATVAQMTADAKLLYPNARVLSLSEQDRDAEGRRAFYAKIKFNDWDMIIIPQSTLDRIPDSPERELQFIQEQIDEKKHLIEMAKQAKVDRKELERLERDLMKKQQEYGDKYLDSDPSNGGKRKKDAKREAAQIDKAETKAQEKLDRATDDVQFFDDLGVDALLVDEAHGYKHLGFETSLGRSVKGVDPSFSKKCAGLYNKTRAVFEKAGWKNVVFATGTPISNTAAEIWTFMKYLMPADVMKENDIYYFDDFVHNFGSINQMLEFKTNGKFNEVTRFAAYVNRPELMRIWMQVADIVRTEEVGEVKAKVPEKEKGKDQDVFLPQSPSLVNIMTAVRAELERFENMTGKEKRENSSIPLTMYGIAKRAAIDPRLVNPDAADEPLSKTNAAVKEILADLKSTKKYNGTVAVFCDNQNRLGNGGVVEFNIFDDMKAKLVAEGVPEKQIAIIKSSMSISAKQKIFDAVNKGEVRVIMGSTQTLGTGVNIQERLHCLIHMDAPDRPMDYTQRNGRIERQGNLHKDWGLPIRILRFGVEDSLDVTAYQRLKTKSGFIDSIMKGKEALANNQTDRTIEEEEEGLFDNPVAVLSGSQFAMKKNQAERELRKLQGKYNAWEADQIYVSAQLRANEAWVRDREKKIAETQEQLDFIRGMFPDGKVKVITVGNTKVDMTKEDAGKKLDEVIKEKINDPVNATVKKLRENEIYNDETIPYTIELDGHPVKLEADIFRTSDWDRGQMRTTIHKRLHFSSGDLRLDDGTGGIGTTRSVREILDDIMQTVISGKGYEDVISNAKLSIQRANESTEQLKQREGQPFQYIKEMAEAKERVEEYTALMKKELEEKEAKYKAQQQDTKDGFDLKKAADTEDDEVRYSADEDWDGETFPIHVSHSYSDTDVVRRTSSYSTDLMPDEYGSLSQLLDAVRRQYPLYYVSIEGDNLRFESWQTVMQGAQPQKAANKATQKYIERKTKRSIDAVNSLADMLHLNVEVLTSTDGLQGKKARSRGWFDPKTGKIVLVLPNHRNQEDLINTLLHEGVAHAGLRKMFGVHFDTFLDNVYNNVSPVIKARIDAAMKRNKWGRHEATEEYLAKLAERTDFDNAYSQGWWNKIKQFFLDMLTKVGVRMQELSDNELRYILWRSYDNLLHPNKRRNIFDKAREVQMQSRLRVGPYRERERIQWTGKVDASRIAAEAEPNNEEMLNKDFDSMTSQEILLSLSQKDDYGRNEAINELVRRIRTGAARIVRMGKDLGSERENDASLAGRIIGGWQLGLSSQSDETLGSVVSGIPPLEGRPTPAGQNTPTDYQHAIIEWAKATGHYISEEEVRESSPDKDVWHSGAQSRVYRTPDGKKVVKFMESWVYWQNPLLKNLDSIALHNAAGFVPMTVIGYSTDKNGKLRIVLEQDYVDGITVDDMFDDEPLIKINNYIDIFMEEELGLVRHIDPDGNLFHMKDGVIYKDFHGANIVVDKDFHRHVIDCYVSLADDDKKERTGSFVIEDNEKELFSIRTKEAPKKTGTGYKVFVLKDGELYPPMVANPGGEGTPVGVWLDADAAPVIGESKTGRPQVKAGGKGTQGGSGQLAYRPGWHLGTIPYALQFGRKDANGNKTLFPNNFVWAEVEYADDVDYQQEAHDAGINANGKYQHALAGLKHVPEDGSYKYRTNPNPNTDEWIITGAMRVKRILTRAEVDELVRKAGREPQQIQDGDIVTDDVVKQLNEEIQAMKEADDMGLLYSADEDWIDIAKGVYERAVAKESLKYQEAWQDSMVSLKAIQDAIAKQTGKVATGAEDAYHFENRMHGRAKNMAEKYIWNFYRPMLKAFHDFCKGKAYTMEQGLDYLVAKSGLERNVYFAFRTAAKDKLEAIVEAERKQIKQDYAHNRIDEKEYKKQMEALAKKEREGIDDVMDEVRNTLAWSRAKEDYANGTIDYTECLRRMEALIRSRLNTYNKYAHDYSGLTETFAKDWYDMAQDVKREAQAAVDPKERAALYHEYNDLMNKAYEMARQYAEDAVFSAEQDNKESVNGLWDAVNESTKETLKFSYESGLMSRSVYDRVRTMFDYYIPLRGWDEDKASDVYEYMGKDNVFSPAVKKAWGRTSKAENPLAYIGNIAVSTILSGHRNQLKQHFLNYVMNNPTNLVSISQSWYENIGTEDSPMWILRTADTAGKDADEIAQIVNDFNEEMQQKQREGLAMPVTGRLRLDVHATKGQKAEHVIEVQRGGHTYELYINGNPKAAQALNGSTARAVSRISDTFIGRQLTKLNRNMAMFFTSKNPAFVISNLSRDMNMAGASVAVNEGPEYNARFMANVAKVLTPRVATGDVASMGLKGLVGKGRGITGLMPKLMKKWQDGKLDDRNETERLFKEFMNEGGETGFVNMLSIDSFKEKMLDEISQMNGSTLFGSKAKVKEASISKALRLIGDTFEFYNRCAEDATRFAVYMTSRQMGKTLEQAIADAKDVTLNFNRKGTGDKGNAEIRDLFIFVNPAIQALANMYQMGKQHPLKLGAVTLGFVTVGALIPVLNAWMQNMWGDDDDKDSYWNLPPWVRKNNLVFWVPGTKNYITIPLAQEFRVFYGVGEMVSSVCYDHPNSNMGMEIVESFADLVPINPTGNGGNLLIDFTPTGAQPLAQLSFNTDFTGKPIWRENQGNKYEPMYTKAYISTPKWMTKISEGINYATGGDQDSRGWLERSKAGAYINNPAVWNHLLQGYFGGMYNTISKSFDVVTTAAQGEIPKVYQTPVVNRFVNRPIEREDAGVLGEDYWKLVDETEETMHNIRKKRQRAAEGDEDAKEALDELMESTDAKRAEVVHHYKGIIDALRKGEKSATDKETKKQIKLSITEWKTQMLEEVNAIDAGVDPLEAAMQQWDKSMNIAERKKLQRRIERLMNKGGGKVNTRDKDVQKAMQYVDNQGESAGSGRYLELATAEDIKNDARIKKVKSQLAVYSNHYKELMKQGKNEEAAEYYKANSKQILAYSTLDRLSRAVSTNKKLLGKGSDAAIMKIIGNSRNAMLKTIEGL